MIMMMQRCLIITVALLLLLLNLGTLDAFTVPRPASTTASCRAVMMSTTSCCLAKVNSNDEISTPTAFASAFQQVLVATVITLAVAFHPNPAWADGSTKEFKLPPVDYSDQNRCIFNSSNMGQANAARDKLYDLRQCNLAGKDATGYDLSGVIMSQTDVSKTKFLEAYFSKAYLRDSNFDGADFTNAIVDRANFRGSSLRGTIFKNAVLTGTSFEGANVEQADFTDAYLGSFDIRNLCKNPTLSGENPTTGVDTRASVGCT